MTTRRRRAVQALVVAVLLVSSAVPARAAVQTRTDGSDAPSGTAGKADLRELAWDVTTGSAKLTVTIDDSSSLAGRAEIGVHVLLDGDNDGIAEREIVAVRNPDGVKVDISLRDLDRTQSTLDCQDLDGKPTSQQQTVASVVANGVETFSFSFDPTLIAGGLATFRWAAFGQAPPNGSAAGPWDVMPDAANPDPAAANPGDRRCDAGKSGVSVRLRDGVAFPDAAPPSDPDPSASPTPFVEPVAPPAPGPAPQPVLDRSPPSLGALSLSRRRFRAAATGPSAATAVGTAVSYSLSEPASVKFRIEAAVPRRGGRGAVHYRRLPGRFIRKGDAGSNTFRFLGRIAGRGLRPGIYRLVGAATDQAGNTSTLRRIVFVIVHD